MRLLCGFLNIFLSGFPTVHHVVSHNTRSNQKMGYHCRPELEQINLDEVWLQQDGVLCEAANETMEWE